jgi:RsiW-degrading membrane proteinase PrsW (M82 family)
MASLSTCGSAAVRRDGDAVRVHETARAAHEAAFRRAGLPLFIDGFSAARDVWTRAVPILSLVFFAEVLGAVDLHWSLVANLATLAGGLAILVGSFAVVNRLRGRPALARPQDIETPELVAFVVIPALLPAVLNGQTTSALVTAAANLTLLVVLYGTIAYGLVSILVWAARRLVSQLAASLQLLARALPLLLLFSVILFINTEMWQVFADMSDATLLATAGLLAAVGTLFLVVRLPREVGALEDQVAAGPPLDRRQRLNVGLVMFVSQGLQVLVVSLAMGAFFVGFGMLVISDSVYEAWTTHPPTSVLDLGALGIDASISRELLHVSGAIAALSGLYYAIAVLTDGTYREEFLSDLTDEMRSSFALRAEYLAAAG